MNCGRDKSGPYGIMHIYEFSTYRFWGCPSFVEVNGQAHATTQEKDLTLLHHILWPLHPRLFKLHIKYLALTLFVSLVAIRIGMIEVRLRKIA
jgi:hypothetical protein